MANRAHLEILTQGVQIWNDWRKKHQDQRVDLTEAKLNKINLSNANLSGVLLARAQLKGARLINANLRGAKLTAADLSGADLTSADLYRATLFKAAMTQTKLIKANFTRANLSKTMLAGAILSRSDFRGADLSGAHMTKAVFYETVLGDTDLTGVLDLESCLHHGPSTIDHRTITKSGSLPMEFLRGCGLPDALISHYLVFANRGMPNPTCLISFSRQDQEFAYQLHADLQDHGIRCWLVPENLKGGKDLQIQLSNAIGREDKLILVLSDQSMTSEWIAQELKALREQEKQEHRRLLYPVSLANPSMIQSWTLMEPGSFVNLAKELRKYPIPNFSDREHEASYQVAFKQLLRDLKSGLPQAVPENLNSDSTAELLRFS